VPVKTIRSSSACIAPSARTRIGVAASGAGARQVSTTVPSCSGTQLAAAARLRTPYLREK
jgi:hypothetical protein